METVEELLIEELRDIYDAEKQLVRALPKMVKGASDPELKSAFSEHLEVTRQQVARLEQVFELMGQKAKSKPCKAMKGLLEEAAEILQEDGADAMIDCAMIGSAQKVEHYEISAYGTARTLAKAIGNREVAGLLDQTAKEEGEADKKLTQIAVRILKMSMRPEPVEMSMGGMKSTVKSARGGSAKKTR